MRGGDIHHHHSCPHGGCDLNAIDADAAAAGDDHGVIGADPGADQRLVGCGHGVSHHGQMGQLVPGGHRIHGHQKARRHGDVGGEPPVQIVAGHFLLRAHVLAALPARVAGAARQDSRDDDLLSLTEAAAIVEAHTISDGFHSAGDFVAQRQR